MFPPLPDALKRPAPVNLAAVPHPPGYGEAGAGGQPGGAGPHGLPVRLGPRPAPHRRAGPGAPLLPGPRRRRRRRRHPAAPTCCLAAASVAAASGSAMEAAVQRLWKSHLARVPSKHVDNAADKSNSPGLARHRLLPLVQLPTVALDTFRRMIQLAMQNQHGRFENYSLVQPMMLLWLFHHLVSMCLQGGPQATPALPAAGRADHSITGGAAGLLHAGALPCLWPAATAGRCSLLLYVSQELQHVPSCMRRLYSPCEPQATFTYVRQRGGAATTFRPINHMALPVHPNAKAGCSASCALPDNARGHPARQDRQDLSQWSQSRTQERPRAHPR